jgi:membrane peptidoglycan carboxypeptidase
MLANAAALIICGLLAGLVVAAAAFPAAALTGLAAKAGAERFGNLPSELEVPHAPQITNVYASDGKTLITSLFDENRRDVPIDQIALVMQEAVVASEDQRFFEHNGVDPKGVLRAFVADQKGQAQQGASTLTMQYVRLAISYSADTPQDVVDATEDTPTRKLREMHLAIALEKEVTGQHGGDKHAAKLDILDRYLNIAPFGHGAFGIYAASQVYFSTTPSQLTLDQAALLAGLLQATSSYDPTTPDGKKAAQARRNTHVLPGMLKLGYIDQAQLTAAQAAPVVTKTSAIHNGCTSTTNARWGFFCDYLYRWWLSQPAFGSDTYARENQLLTGGYKIVTSLNVSTQAAADKAIKKYD